MVAIGLCATADPSHHGQVSLHQSLPARCEPACHGCRHRTLTPEASLAQKQHYLGVVLAPWADRLQPAHSVPPDQRFGYRDRVTLNARWDAMRGWRFGLMRRDELIAIHDCPVHSARVNRLVHCLREHASPHADFPLAYLHVAGGQATLVVKNRRLDPGVFEALIEQVPQVGLDGLWLHLHPAAGRRLFARRGWQLLWGAPRSVGPGGIVHGPTAFQQLLPRLHAVSLDVAARHLVRSPGASVLDLYCGIGVSLRRWLVAGAATLGVELAGGAVDCIADNAPGAAVLRGTCVQRLPQIREWWGRQAAWRAAYVNPPRRGLEREVLAALAHELRPQRLAYLSCSAGTLACDLGEFQRAGYVVTGLVPFDFFPGTHHVECLALLETSDSGP